MSLRFKAAVVGVSLLFFMLLANWSNPQVKSESTPDVSSSSNISVEFISDPTGPNADDIFRKVNEIRVQNGLTALIPNRQLSQLAALRAEDMSEHSYYSHQDPTGKYYYDYFKVFGLQPDYSCENLDLGFTNAAEPYVDDWLGSKKGHRECLLNKSVTQGAYAVKTVKFKQPGSITITYVAVGIQATN